ncbi:MAG: hypothetical protein ACYCPV_02095 [Thermoplasmata archaeon]
MADRTMARPSTEARAFRCRCGHLPSDHMVVVPIGTSGSFRLDPQGPCALCAAAVCPRFSPATDQP